MSTGSDLAETAKALATPANTLIEKISNAIGAVFEPHQIVRLAKAESKAAIIKANTQIELTDIQRRAMHRMLEEETRKQINIENVTKNALPYVQENAEPDKISNDWVINFFEKSQNTTDEEMQNLWSKLLAGEANTPGKFSKRTVNLLADLDKKDAELFTSLCSFTWNLGGISAPMIFYPEIENIMYKEKGLNFSNLTHLETLGLVSFNNLAEFQFNNIGKILNPVYFGVGLLLSFPNLNGNTLSFGHVMLTQAGQELLSVCTPQKVEGFFEYMQSKWDVASLLLKPTIQNSESTDTSSAQQS